MSPHFDDAILSCGGLIYAQRQAGQRVGVLTLCANSPRTARLSALAQKYESAWSESGTGYAHRQAENAAVLSAWRVEDWGCGTPDAIYRAGESGTYYETRSDLFDEPDPQDAACVQRIWEATVQQAVEGSQNVILYAPLGVGRHVDHELARRLGQSLREKGRPVWFYEDYPYIELEPDGLATAQTRCGIRKGSCRVVPIDVQAKIKAVRGYHSQLGRVFGSDRDLVRRVKEFTAETACALNAWERRRRRLAPSGIRLRIWRLGLGYHAHAERIWR
ncbi:MAG: PIG-L family deacetylase [Chloroflexi bacterium]|nr:PIG-L family deacetylase [Chloroflexota bacterium]